MGGVCVWVPMPGHTLSITMGADLVCSLGQVMGWLNICSVNHDYLCGETFGGEEEMNLQAE